MPPNGSASSALEPDAVVLGQTLRRLRTAQELTLRELADRAAVDYSMLSKVERGLVNPSRRWLKDVGEALGVHLGQAS